MIMCYSAGRALRCVCVGLLSDEQVRCVEEEIHYLSIRRLLMQTLMGLVHVPGDSQDPGSGSRTGSGSWSRVWVLVQGLVPVQGLAPVQGPVSISTCYRAFVVLCVNV